MENVSHADELGNSNSEDEPFDWERDPAVILHDQAAVAAYFNPINELVISSATLSATKPLSSSHPRRSTASYAA
jgi:hypothetical protein